MIVPVLFRVIVKPITIDDLPEVRSAKAAGIIMPDHEDTRLQEAALTKGTVVSIGPTAFEEYRQAAKKPNADIPAVGDEVHYAKYAGKRIKDTDGQEYIALNDEDVIAIVK